MNVLNFLVTIGIISILGGFMYVGRKLQILDDLQSMTRKIKVNLKVVSDFLTSTSNDFDHKELQSYSPLRLTAAGNKLIKEIGFESAFQKHAQDFCDFIENDHPKLKYDVERSAIRAVFALYDKDYMSFLKVFFYNHPKRNIKNTAPTLDIYVRDKYLAVHPEITE